MTHLVDVCRSILESHQTEMDLLLSQQKETKTKSRLVRKEERINVYLFVVLICLIIRKSHIFFVSRHSFMIWRR